MASLGAQFGADKAVRLASTLLATLLVSQPMGGVGIGGHPLPQPLEYLPTCYHSLLLLCGVVEKVCVVIHQTHTFPFSSAAPLSTLLVNSSKMARRQKGEDYSWIEWDYVVATAGIPQYTPHVVR